MAKSGAAKAKSPGRKSSRAAKAPKRFRPGGNANMPSSYETMVQQIAAEAAKKAPLPLSNDAIQALEQALEPAIDSFINAAVAHSEKHSNGDVGAKDFEAVLAFYKKHKAAM